MAEESKGVNITGYEIDLDEIVENYAKGMVFTDADENKVVDMDTLRYYVDASAKKVLLYMNVGPARTEALNEGN